MFNDSSHDQLLALAAQIVCAHVGNNDLAAEALPDLIKDVYGTLADIAPAEKMSAPVSLPRNHNQGHTHQHAAAGHAMSDDLLVCLEDGLSMKMLKRHLLTVHGLTPDQYRAKWNLPADYPMVAANYAKLRSALAKESGLGLRPEARPKRRRF